MENSTSKNIDQVEIEVPTSLSNYLLGFIIAALVMWLYFPFYKTNYIQKAQGLSSALDYPKGFDILLSYALIFIPAVFCFLSPLKNKIRFTIPKVKQNFFIFLSHLLERASLLASKTSIQISMCLLACLTRFSNLASPFDSYHFGEYVIPYFNLTQFGSLPYLGTIPSHGLINYLPALIFGNAPSSVYAGYAILTFIINLVLCGIVLKKSDNKLLAILIILLFPSTRISYLAGLVLIIVWKDIYRNSRLVDCILASGLIIIFGGFEVSTGIAMAVSYTILCGFYLYREKLKLDLKKVILLFPYVLLLILLAFPISRLIIVELLKTIKELASLNLDGFGIPFYLSFTHGKLSYLTKFALLPLSTILLVSLISPKLKLESKALNAAMLAFSFLLMGYSMGRIDSTNMSRCGLMSGFIFFYYLTQNFSSYKKTSQLITVLVLTYFAVGRITTIFHTPRKIIKNYQESSKIESYDELETLNKIQSKYQFKSGEYLDLTNNNLNYYFLKMESPLPGTSMYNTVAQSQWDKIQERQDQLKFILLKDNHPRFHDEISLMNRSSKIAESFAKDCYLHLKQDLQLVYLVRENYCEDQYQIKIKALRF